MTFAWLCFSQLCMVCTRHQSPIFPVRHAAEHGNVIVFDSHGINMQRDGEVLVLDNLNDATHVMNLRVCKPDTPAEGNIATTEDKLYGCSARLGLGINVTCAKCCRPGVTVKIL